MARRLDSSDVLAAKKILCFVLHCKETIYISPSQVDCTESGKDTCSKHGVSGYPTLKVFRKGQVSKDYDGPRDAGKLTHSPLNGSYLAHQC